MLYQYAKNHVLFCLTEHDEKVNILILFCAVIESGLDWLVLGGQQIKETMVILVRA